MKSKIKKIILFILRSAVTILLLYAIFKKLNIFNSFGLILKANFFYFLLYLILVLIFQFVSVLRWHYALKANQVYLKFNKLLIYHFISLFLQNFLPSTFGHDMVKGFLSFKGNPKIRILNSLFICRATGIFFLFLIAIIGVSFIDIKIPEIKFYILLFFILYTIFFLLLFNRRIQKFFISISNYKYFRLLKKIKIEIIFEKLNTYKNPKVLFNISALSIMIHLLTIFGYYVLFLATNENIGIKYLFVYIPLITAITFLPISIGGLGVRENLYYFFFKNLVMDLNSLTIFIILSLATIIIFSIPGAILFLLKKY